MPVTASNPFKWHHCPGDIILWCVRAPEVSDLICAYGRDGARTWSADPLQLYLLCVARRWPVPLATLFNGEPVGDETGGGHVRTVNGDYWRGTWRSETESPGRLQRFRRGVSYPACGILGIYHLTGNSFSELLCCFAPRVAMVQTTKAWHRSHDCARCRLWLDGATVRGVFFERIVNPVPMVVAHVITHEPE